MGRIALRQAGTFQQFFPIKMDIPRFYPGFPRSFSAGKALFHVSFASFPQKMLKTGWKLLKTVCFFNTKNIPYKKLPRRGAGHFEGRKCT
jgi:hypothetical protein